MQMSTRRRLVSGAVCLLILFYSISCGGDSPSAPSSASSICFNVSGFNVSVANLFRNGTPYSVNVQGLTGFNETVSQNNETHSLQWTNIRNNNTTRTVDSFNVRIDSRDFSYPADRCR